MTSESENGLHLRLTSLRLLGRLRTRASLRRRSRLSCGNIAGHLSLGRGLLRGHGLLRLRQRLLRRCISRLVFHLLRRVDQRKVLRNNNGTVILVVYQRLFKFFFA